MPQTDIRVFIADDHPETVNQLSTIINAESDMRVVASVTNGKDLQEYFEKGGDDINVALIDIGLPGADGLVSVGKIKKANRIKARIIVITGLSGKNYPRQAMSKHADGFISKYHFTKEELVDSLRKVVDTGEFIYMPDPTEHPASLTFSILTLTPTERLILCMLVNGKTNKEISDMVSLTVPNVEKYRRNVAGKFEVENNTANLVRIAEQYNVCDDD